MKAENEYKYIKLKSYGDKNTIKEIREIFQKYALHFDEFFRYYYDVAEFVLLGGYEVEYLLHLDKMIYWSVERLYPFDVAFSLYKNLLKMTRKIGTEDIKAILEIL